MTFGGSGGMAGRRGKSIKPGKVGTKVGLRSQVLKVANTEGTEGGADVTEEVGGAAAMEPEEVEWSSEGSGEETKGFEKFGARPKQRRRTARKTRSVEPPGLTTRPGESTMVEMFRDFLIGQQRKEDLLVRELRQLKSAIAVPGTSTAPLQPQNPVPSLNLPTDGPTPVPGGQHPTSTSQSRGSVPPGANTETQMRRGPKMLPFQPGDDIENFLVRFERVARTWGWPQSEWACRLVPLLTGKALDAYSSMEEDASNVYADLKEALLAKFDISPETYRLQFRSTFIPPSESPKETYNRLKSLYRKWIQPEQRSKEEIEEQLILEQSLRMLPNDMKTWVKEHEPADGLSAAKLAGQYLNARKGLRMPRQQNKVVSQDVADLPRRGDHRVGGPERRQGASGETRWVSRPGPPKDLICYHCQQPGHRASVCPLKQPKHANAGEEGGNVTV